MKLIAKMLLTGAVLSACAVACTLVDPKKEELQDKIDTEVQVVAYCITRYDETRDPLYTEQITRHERILDSLREELNPGQALERKFREHHDSLSP